MLYQQAPTTSATVRDDDPKQVAVAMLFLAWIYNLIALYLALYNSLVTVLSMSFNFFTIAAVVYIYQFIYSTAYLFTKYNKGYRLMRLCTLISFFYLGLNILAMFIMVFKEDSTTDDVNAQIAIFMFIFAPWAAMAAAVLNVLKMDQKAKTESKPVQVVYLVPGNQIHDSNVIATKENLLA